MAAQVVVSDVVALGDQCVIADTREQGRPDDCHLTGKLLSKAAVTGDTGARANVLRSSGSVGFCPCTNILDPCQGSFEFRSEILLVREICRLGQKCDLHKEAVQHRHNWKIIRVSRAQCCELPTHLDEIERFMVRLLFQIKLAQKPYDQTKPPRRVYWRNGFATWDPDQGQCPVRRG